MHIHVYLCAYVRVCILLMYTYAHVCMFFYLQVLLTEPDVRCTVIKALALQMRTQRPQKLGDAPTTPSVTASVAWSCALSPHPVLF